MPEAEGFVIAEVDWTQANDADFEDFTAFEAAMLEEAWPWEPRPAVDETRRVLLSTPPSTEYHRWTARKEGNDLAGIGEIWIKRGPANQHAANFQIAVLPRWRRLGIATALLAPITHAAAAADRRLLVCWSSELVPATGAFLARLNGRMGMTTMESILELDRLDRGLVAGWLRTGEMLSSEFELGFWDGPYPESQHEAIAELHHVMNSMPHEDLEREDEVWTVADLLETEEMAARNQTRRWAAYVRRRDTGGLVGYTELHWHDEHPEFMGQADTGVVAEYRNRGIGRWLKAAMVDRVVHERPEVRRIRTWNAASNGPMLRINQAMGFHQVLNGHTWEVDLGDAQAYLRSVA